MTVTDEALLHRRQQVLGRHSPLFYERPLHLVSGEGVWVTDADGRRYLDVYNNVPHVGHCHPHVVEALCRQAAALNIHTRYLHETIVDYGERLTATFDDPLSVAMFVCTGTEANELALRIARQCTGNEGIIVSDCSYHGNSRTLAELTTAFPTPEALAPHVRAVPIPDPYRDGGDPQTLAERYVAMVGEAIRSLAADGIRPAALLVDTIFSSEGLPAIPPGYLERATALVREAGGLLIADEVQPGFGRTGDHMWGYAAFDLVPDLVTMGKPMGNGHPIGCTIARPDLVERFGAKTMYFNTFGGNPVSAVVGMAVLDVIEREALMANARTVGAYVLAGLTRLMERHERIGDVRGKGLFFGLELVEDRASRSPAGDDAKRLINLMRDAGVLVSRIGRFDNVLKMRPPMVFSRDNADLLLATLDACLGRL